MRTGLGWRRRRRPISLYRLFSSNPGLKYTTASKSGFLTGLYIVLVPLIGAVVYQKVPGLSEWIGVSLATVGMGLMTLTSARIRDGSWVMR